LRKAVRLNLLEKAVRLNLLKEAVESNFVKEAVINLLKEVARFESPERVCWIVCGIEFRKGSCDKSPGGGCGTESP
jgi:hypothetical protein